MNNLKKVPRRSTLENRRIKAAQTNQEVHDQTVRLFANKLIERLNKWTGNGPKEVLYGQFVPAGNVTSQEQFRLDLQKIFTEYSVVVDFYFNRVVRVTVWW
jgi:hypothetical protein